MDDDDITVQQQQFTLYFLPPPCSCFPFQPPDIRSLISLLLSLSLSLSLTFPLSLFTFTSALVHTPLPFRQAHHQHIHCIFYKRVVMGAQAVDYRISRVVVCCKDCGQDVGLYPARHKCQEVIRPPLPPLPANLDDHHGLRVPTRTNDNVSRSRSTSSSSSTLNTPSDTSSTTTTGSKWTARFGRSPSTKNNTNDPDNEEESVYFNNFAAHLPEGGDSPGSGQSGKKLWGKVRQNEKWKQLSEKCKFLLSWMRMRRMEMIDFLFLLDDKPKQSAKLWGKLVQATQTVADKMPARDDRGPGKT